MAGVPVLPLAFPHGHLRVYGYRFGRLAYLTDVKDVGTVERAAPAGARRAGARTRSGGAPIPPTSASTRRWRSRSELGAARTYLTHLTHETGHAELAARLPAGVAPAYDGLTVEIA